MAPKAPKPIRSETLTREQLMAAVNKKWGADTMTAASDPRYRIEKLPTGELAIDEVTRGGLARGRHTELYGSPSVGKTALAYYAIATTQNSGGACCYVDVEKTFSDEMAAHHGVNNEELDYHRQKHGPRVVDFVETLLRSNIYDLVVIDSIASLLPMADYDNDMEAGSYGMEQAKLMSKALRKLTAANDRTAVLWINQTRCLPATDPVILVDRVARIGEIQVGDRIYDGHGWTTVRAVEHTVTRGVTFRAKSLGPREMSLNHRQPIYRNGEYQEVLGQDLRIGDWLCIADEAVMADQDAANDETETSPSDLLDAAVLGAYFADGYYGEYEKSKFIGIPERSSERRMLVRGLLSSKFNKHFAGNSATTSVGAPEARQFVKQSGVGTTSINKSIPSAVANGTFPIIREFLRYASFDTHGFERNRFIWTFETERQTQEFKNLLARLGIKSSVEQSRKPGKDWTHLSLAGTAAKRFRDLIGFAEEKKMQRSAHFHDDVDYARGSYDVVPFELFCKIWELDTATPRSKTYRHYQCFNQVRFRNGELNASRRRLVEYAQDHGVISPDLDRLAHFRLVEVVEVQQAGEFDAVDIKVDGGLFVANGLLTHNSNIGSGPFAKKSVTSGGRAMGFYASTRLEFVRTETLVKKGPYVDPKTGEIKDKDRTPYGHRIQVQVAKDKAGARPMDQTTMVFDYETGKFDHIEDLMYLGRLYGFVEKRGNSWWVDEYEKYKKGSRAGFKKWLKKNPKIAAELEQWIRNSIEPEDQWSEGEDDERQTDEG